MKTFALLALLALPIAALAQGSLTPPGAPAPTMRTLTQLEPRIPLEDGIPGLNREANGGFTIQNPGSYYLTGNLSVASGDAITINSNTVTLDLNGFALSSRFAGTGGSGITTAPNASGITIRNGFVRSGVTTTVAGFSGSGFLHGINAATTHNVRVEDVTVQGLVGNGITLASGSGIIRACSARLCGGVGLRANQVLDSQALQCGAAAIFAGTAPDAGTPSLPVADGTASNCYGESITGAPGVFASTAINCFGKSDSGPGLHAQTATGCRGQSLSGPGLLAQTATNCIGVSTSGVGLQATQSAADCSGTSRTNTGLSADTATNCTGTSTSNEGLHAQAATNCHGTTSSGMYGLKAESTAENCTGESTSGGLDRIGLSSSLAHNCQGTVRGTGSTADYPNIGLQAATATNCRGSVVFTTSDDANYGIGLKAETATDCFGSSSCGGGLVATQTATNCNGTIPYNTFITSGQPTDIGLTAETAANCRGYVSRGTGLSATTATHSYGCSHEGDYGLLVEGTASYCRGFNTGASAIKAAIAIGCTTAGGTIDAPQKFLGTP